MKISASIYSKPDGKLEEIVKDLDQHKIDYFHIDCLDDTTVFDDIKHIRKVSKTPIDLHIISSEPEKFYDGIAETNTELVSFQYENLKEKLKVPDTIHSKIGLAIVSSTPTEVYEEYKEDCSFILFMTTTPGKSGGEFDKKNFKKIREFRRRFPGRNIHVDGGVNEEVSFILRNMGVYAAVSGSYLMKADSMSSAMMSLKMNDNESHYQIKDFMLGPGEIPLLELNDELQIGDVLKSIEDNNMGFTILKDPSNKMAGIITNADIRKGMLMHLDDLNKINVSEILNPTPVAVEEDKTVREMLNLIKQQKFPILFLPVINSAGEAVGALKFHNLIKGES